MHSTHLAVAYGALTRSGRPFQDRSADMLGPSERSVARSHRHVLPPEDSADWLVRPMGLGSSRFARRYSGNPLFSSGY